MSSVRGLLLTDVLYVAVFAGCGALVWGSIGALLSLTGGQSFAVVAATVLYALVWGALEVRRSAVRIPSLTWQVPAKWVQGKGRLVRTMIWGATLGPGLMTRNPFAAMWFLPLLLLSVGPGQRPGLGLLLGLAHGSARAVGIITNRRTCVSPQQIVVHQMYWRRYTGAALLGAAMILAGVAYASMVR